MSHPAENENFSGLEIAIIGMAGQFPGAKNIKEFWENLKNNVNSITMFTDETLKEVGVNPELLTNPNYVKAGAFIEDRTKFDAFFFGYSPREAELMVPQTRIFHQCVWSALEDAGYVPDSYPGKIGFYAGASSSSYWELLSLMTGKTATMGEFAARTYFDKDQLNMRISYNLNLTGPSLALHTACSTSLVAVHLACQGILSGDCEMALAGGVSLSNADLEGYLYQEGSIYSPDGQCRPFDAGANGTIVAEGIGVVVLKAFENAVVDRDNIYAVIKGSAVNNDGHTKMGYSTPSGKGQAQVIFDAYNAAQIDPKTISYIEAHGTGTPIGDPIEIEALKSVFGTDRKKFCAIGSVKSNVGHLIAAAGVAGLIKTALALKHRIIPSTIHFKTPNPKMDLENSPFYVLTGLTPWNHGTKPLRAGVNSFGIGGTNAHVILEEAPLTSSRISSTSTSTSATLQKTLLFSAKSQSALEKMTVDFLQHIKETPGINLDDAAYTLQVGRKTFDCRRTLNCLSVEEAVEVLSSPGSRKVNTFVNTGDKRPLVFVFPGLGGQYVNMGLELYRQESEFRKHLDQSLEILESLAGFDIKQILYPGEISPEHIEKLNSPGISQPVIFIFEYSLGMLLMKWGIEPQAMIGYSFGEYVAACLAGVFSLEDALKLITIRGKLIQKTQPGRMISVPFSIDQLIPMVDSYPLSLAIDNGSSCIVAGETSQVKMFEERLKEKKIVGFPLPTHYAIHSELMEVVVEEFEAAIKQIRLNKPRIPYISNRTGDWIRDEDATTPGYWARHLRETVRFADGVNKLLENANPLFLEVGPGREISTLMQRFVKKESHTQIINLVRAPGQDVSDVDYLWNKIGRMWLYGIDVDWKKLYNEKPQNRISLPTYPFEGMHIPIERIDSKIPGMSKDIRPEDCYKKKKTDISEWLYVPVWKQSFLPVCPLEETNVKLNWMVFIDEHGLGDRLVEFMARDCADIKIIRAGKQFQEIDEGQFMLNPANAKDYEALFNRVKELKKIPHKIVHLWNITGNRETTNLENIDQSQDMGFYSLLNIARSIGVMNILSAVEIELITDNMHQVTGAESFLCPEKATALGAIKVIPLEYPNIKSRNIDIVLPPPGDALDRMARDLETELHKEIKESDNIIIAYRGGYRWEKSLKNVRMDRYGARPQRLRENGVYLITGGLGGMGLTFADYLAESVKARLILVGRKSLPAREEWSEWLAHHPMDNAVSRKIRKLEAIEKNGSKIMIFGADISDLEQMKQVIARAEEQFGPINGILHAAGSIDFSGVIQGQTKESTGEVFAPKLKGTLVMEQIFKDTDLDFLVLFSTLSTSIYQMKYGQVGYVAANEFLDAFTYYKKLQNKVLTITINWTDWKEVGMSVDAYMHEYAREGMPFGSQALIDESISNTEGMRPKDGVEVLVRILSGNIPRVEVASFDLAEFLKSIKKYGAPKSLYEMHRHKEKKDYCQVHLTSEYMPPSNDLEIKIAEVWQDLFGYEKIGVNDDFFELGGDSLLSITFSNRFKEMLGEPVLATIMFEARTIAELVEYFARNYPGWDGRMKNEGGMKEEENLEMVCKEETENLEKILNEIPNLPDDKIDLLLSELLSQEKNEADING